MTKLLKKILPDSIVGKLSFIKQGLKRANIKHPFGLIDPFEIDSDQIIFVMAVGSAFDQERPDAMMTCRMGYCNAFEALGIPYLIVDVRNLASVATSLSSPFIMYFAGDLQYLPSQDIKTLRKYPSAVWVYPWFTRSKEFFKAHELDYTVWTLPDSVIEKIMQLNPRFGFTATTESGLHFFDEWERKNIPIKSYPLACDTTIYFPTPNYVEDFNDVELAFVGGYWKSKGSQIDAYLRPFENQLSVYGYTRWPYKGYKGLLPVEIEPSLYHQARICPVINEPTVALMSGQINERVFKVLGSGGCPIVDAVPAYRELFDESELCIAKSPTDFIELVRVLSVDTDLNMKYRQLGKKAVLSRHTYVHRAQNFLFDLFHDSLLVPKLKK
ncbi:glycosyltransferase family protein [Polynucleobacter sp.]|uniref:glycosyltransferase family protein n=1 Tax=Polynucleobacter sp. TaxID=2029855 RepID=UPI003F69AFB3